MYNPDDALQPLYWTCRRLWLTSRSTLNYPKSKQRSVIANTTFADDGGEEMTGSIDAKVEQRIDALLKGAIAPHVPSGPSTAPWGIDHVELLQQASQAGFAAMVARDHDYSGVMTAARINKHASSNDVKGIAAMSAFVEHSLCTFRDRARDRHRGFSGIGSICQNQM
jgi:Family of unknown function (DUF6282)